MEDIGQYEGLVCKTAFLFADMVGYEVEDLRQELRLKIVKARRSFDPTRSRVSERNYVYSCVANFVKDLKKLAARRAALRVNVTHIADAGANFEARYQHVSEEDAFSFIQTFAWPSGVTDEEKQVTALLIVGYSHAEAAGLMELSATEIAAMLRGLREKLADWKPVKGGAEIIPFPEAPSSAPPVDAPLDALAPPPALLAN